MRYSFIIKAAVAGLLVVAFDRLCPGDMAGTVVGVFSCLWLIGLIAGRADVRRDPRAKVALAATALFGASLIYDPGALGWTMFWCALSLAALLPRTGPFDDAWRWAVRLCLHAASSGVRPIRDLRQGLRRPRGRRRDIRATLAILAFPLIGGSLFLTLFAAANPVIAETLAMIRLPSLWQVIVWLIVGFGVWPSLRPHPVVLRVAARLPDPEPVLPGTSLPSVLIALALFNALFALQNVLDIVFLWGGGPLPTGMTQTEYVHRGAYPLIVTTLIAGIMALAMFRPGTVSAQHPWARRMVVAWVVQNLILVASSAWRTIDYVATSMLTGWRIAALAWMALVAVGLVTICWRILKGRSAPWLVNWNAAAALAVLVPCTFLDLGAIAAEWNVRHQSPASIDLCYLNEVGDGALLPLIELEHLPMNVATRDRVHYVRELLLGRLDARQSNWQTWTPRGEHHLTLAKAVLGAFYHPIWPVDGDAGRACDGARLPLIASPQS